MKQIKSVDDFMLMAAEAERSIDCMVKAVQEIKDDRGRPISLDLLHYDLGCELLRCIHSTKNTLERLVKTGAFIEVKDATNNQE